MIIICTRFMPLRRFAAVNLFGILFAPAGMAPAPRTIRHEAIHTAQMKEMLYLFFYLWYLIEWFIRLFGRGNAYRNIAFEKEAYLHEQNRNYLKQRKPFGWIRYL